MSDYIMNRESLKLHCEIMCERFKGIPTSGAYSEHKFVLDLLEQTEWIPISERLPESDDDVLVCDDVNTFVAWYDGNKWNSNDCSFERYRPIMAWMPLPQPHNAESEDKHGLYRIGY